MLDGIIRLVTYKIVLTLTSMIFSVNIGVMYSGEYDACDVTLSVYPHRASLKNMPDYY
jgi:hypothetical protein